MKIPKSVLIGGRTFKILTNKKERGGHFNCGKQEIVIGTKGTKEEISSIFLHEVLEAILTDRDNRYELPYDEITARDYQFLFNHADFVEIIKALNLALKDCLI